MYHRGLSEPSSGIGQRSRGPCSLVFSISLGCPEFYRQRGDSAHGEDLPLRQSSFLNLFFSFCLKRADRIHYCEF